MPHTRLVTRSTVVSCTMRDPLWGTKQLKSHLFQMKTANPLSRFVLFLTSRTPHRIIFRKDSVSVGIPIDLDSSLAIDYYVTLAVFAISLDNCDHLWEFRFPFLDRSCVPVRIVTSIQTCPYRDAVIYPTNTNSKANFFSPGLGCRRH